MTLRERLLSFLDPSSSSDFIPAAFFMHFDSDHKSGQPAIDKHLEYFRHTGMDFVKIQYEQIQPPFPHIRKPSDWAHAPLYPPEFFEPTGQVVRGLVEAAARDALVVLTLYSPLMWLAQLNRQADLVRHFKEDPDAVAKGLAVMTENVLNLVRACKRHGVDGFYASTQGGESTRLGRTDLFRKYVKPSDLAVWDEFKDLPFNILHVCDYEGPYDDLSPFLDYPGQVVNSSLKIGPLTYSPREMSRLFKRPFMGGLERKGVIATGNPDSIRLEVESVLHDAPERFILAADCTVPPETPWDNLKTAIDIAHQFRK